MNELERQDMTMPAISAEQMQMVSMAVQQMMEPVMANMCKILERNNEAMERIAATQQMMTSRISELEKQVRLKTPMSRAQENCINGEIRAKARELLDSRGYADDRKAVTKLGGMIRKSILTRYGVDSLREAPAYDYETALDQIKYWKDIPAIREVVKGALEREKKALEDAERAAGADGAGAKAAEADQPGEPDLRDADRRERGSMRKTEE